MKKAISILLAAYMMIFLTACGTVSQQDVRPTTEHSTEEVGNNDQNEPVDPIDDGYWHDDPTEEPTTEEPTEEPSTTPEQSGTYTYDVDGVQITLRTNIDDYIYTNSAGANCINMLAIAQSLGFEYTGTHPDELELQIGFHLVSDPSYFVYVTDEVVNQNMGTVQMEARGNNYEVSFARSDINNDSIRPYWIANGGNTVRYAINYEQIVIFTYLLENGCYAPSEDWLATSGLAVSSSSDSDNVYSVNK